MTAIFEVDANVAELVVPVLAAEVVADVFGAERVLALAQAGDEDLALRFAAGVQASLPDTPPPSADGLAEAVRGGRVTDICAQLFLPGPESADLTAEQDSGILASPFMNRWVVLRLDRPDPTEALRDLIGGAEPEEHSG